MTFGAQATTVLLCAALAGASGCDARAAHASTPPASAKAAQSVAKASGGDVIAVSAGSMRAGTAPGSPGRNPALEADSVAVELGAFEIDRRPFPNDPSRPALTGIDQPAASAACAKSGKRLCSELEWESACDSAQGFLAPVNEWTSSAANATHAIVRGLGNGQGSERCSARADADAGSSAQDRGFRCCKGEAQTASYPAPALDDAPVASLTPSLDDVRAALAGAAMPAALKALAKDFTLFGDADVSAALRRGKRSRENITAQAILDASFAWSPVPGEQLHVITGRAGDAAALVVLYPLGGGAYAHAASAILREPEATFALGYREGVRDQLSWTTCYGCPSEGGGLRYDGGRVTIDFR